MNTFDSNDFSRSVCSYLVGTAVLKNGSSGILVYETNIRKNVRIYAGMSLKGAYSLLVPVSADEVWTSTLTNRTMDRLLYTCNDPGHPLTAASSNHKEYVFLRDGSAGELPDEIEAVDYAGLREAAERARWLAVPEVNSRGESVIVDEAFLEAERCLCAAPAWISEGFVLIGPHKEMTDEEKHRAERLMTDAIDGYLADEFGEISSLDDSEMKE